MTTPDKFMHKIYYGEERFAVCVSVAIVTSLIICEIGMWIPFAIIFGILSYFGMWILAEILEIGYYYQSTTGSEE